MGKSISSFSGNRSDWQLQTKENWFIVAAKKRLEPISLNREVGTENGIEWAFKWKFAKRKFSLLKIQIKDFQIRELNGSL